jgi:hypothetical protein
MTFDIAVELAGYLNDLISECKHSGPKIRRLIASMPNILDDFLALDPETLKDNEKGFGQKAVEDVKEIQRLLLLRMRALLTKAPEVHVPIVLTTREIKILSQLIRSEMTRLGGGQHSDEVVDRMEKLNVISRKFVAQLQAANSACTADRKGG